MEKLIKRLNEQSDGEYSSQIKVNLDIDGVEGEVEYAPKIMAKYRIDIEYRSYGIKDITMMVIDPIEIEYMVEGETSYTTLKLDISELRDTNKLLEEWVAGGGYFIDSIDIYLNKDRSVRNVTLESVYAKPYGA